MPRIATLTPRLCCQVSSSLIRSTRKSFMILPSAFDALWAAPEGMLPAFDSTDTTAHWFVFNRQRLLVVGDRRQPRLPLPGEIPLTLERSAPRFVGVFDGKPCWAADSALDDLGDIGQAYSWEPVRALFSRLPDEPLAVGARALQMLEFDRTHRFCGVCATATEVHEGGRSRRCPQCGETAYPRVAPAMMVLIKRDTSAGRELLLARSPRFPGGMYSALAGFVEISESIEDCVHREAFEEVGVHITNLQYFDSQAWPFPNSLMIAFVADWASGEIKPEAGEIEDARWFSMQALPQLPHRLSIARRLIDAQFAAPDQL